MRSSRFLPRGQTAVVGVRKASRVSRIYTSIRFHRKVRPWGKKEGNPRCERLVRYLRNICADRGALRVLKRERERERERQLIRFVGMRVSTRCDENGQGNPQGHRPFVLARRHVIRPSFIVRFAPSNLSETIDDHSLSSFRLFPYLPILVWSCLFPPPVCSSSSFRSMFRSLDLHTVQKERVRSTKECKWLLPRNSF